MIEETPKKTPKKLLPKGMKEPWKKGQSGNPNGRPKGVRNFSTLLDEAIKKIAKEENIKMAQAETELVIRAYKEARKGNFNYYRDIMDRKFGKPKEQIELEVKRKMVILDE